MRRTIAILFIAICPLLIVSCGDSGTESEEPIPHDFTTAPSEELSQIVEETPSDFTWGFFNDNIEITLHDDPQWSGPLVISGFQIQNGEVVNTMTSEAVQTHADELANGLSTEELFAGSSWIPGSDWISTEEWIPSTNWFPGEMWAPAEMEEVAMSQNDLAEDQALVVFYAHVPTESVEREQVTRPFGITFQQRQPSTGTLEVITTTSGSNDQSYTLYVDGAHDTPVNANDSVRVSGLSDGSHQAELGQIPADCAVSGNNPKSVTITAGQTTTTTFDIDCQAGMKNKIAFTSLRDGNTEIYLMDADGSNQQRLTDNSDYDGYPVISNNGSQIAFVSGRAGGQHLFTMDAGGSNIQQVTTATSDPGFYSWSPDNSEIALTDFGSSSLQIYKVNADGSGRTQLTTSSSRDAFPTWSPGGDKIAFVSDRDGDEPNIYTVDTDGNNIQQISTTVTLASYSPYPRWSPDGEKILFLGADGVIYTMDSNGGNEQQVTNGRSATWSSDGSEIVFTRDDEIYKINSDGSGTATQLTDNSEIDFAPFWSPAE